MNKRKSRKQRRNLRGGDLYPLTDEVKEKIKNMLAEEFRRGIHFEGITEAQYLDIYVPPTEKMYELVGSSVLSRPWPYS